MLGTAAPAEDKISLEAGTHTKFSVWVSFCEIYNENIHDLLEVIPSGALRRTALRLSQDVKGNAFVKGLNRHASYREATNKTINYSITRKIAKCLPNALQRI